MKIEDTLKNLRKELLSHTIILREKIESPDNNLSHKNGFIKTLLDIEELLSNQLPDLNRLSRDKFGIYRMIDGNANTPIEKELMVLHEEIHNLIKVSKNLEQK